MRTLVAQGFDDPVMGMAIHDARPVIDVTRVITPDGETTVPKADIDERTAQKKSLMPDGQHLTMSPAEFADLIAYLRSL